MFCPLCKYEYRDGFTECSDCHLHLVPTKEDAQRESVALAWKGSDKRKLDRVLDSLQNAGIAFRFKESVDLHPRFMVFGFRIGNRLSAVENHFEVTVLGRDLQRARRAMSGHTASAEISETDNDIGTD